MLYRKAILIIMAVLFTTGKSFSQHEVLYRQNAAGSEYFGIDCDVDRDCFIVGSDYPGTWEWHEKAVAYSFDEHGERLYSELESNDYDDNGEDNWRNWDYDQGFGAAVAIDTIHAVVGAYRDSYDDWQYAGSAYVFQRQYNDYYAGVPIKLKANDASDGQEFGKAVDISGDYIICGAPDIPNSGKGSAYIFSYNDAWTLEAKIQADDGESEDAFGSDVAIEGNIAVVGAKNASINGSSRGAAYVFVRENEIWTQKAKLCRDDLQSLSHFGKSVAISHEYIIIGADGGNSQNACKGRAFVYEKPADGWADVSDGHELIAPAVVQADQYGSSVSIDQSVAAVCSPMDVIDSNHKGSISLFRRESGQWAFAQKLYCTEINSVNGFVTNGMGMHDGRLLVGASTEDGEPPYNEPEAGRAYLFTYDVELVYNIFTGIGNWSDPSHWSLLRLPEDGDHVLIKGHCTLDQSLSIALNSLIVDTTPLPLPRFLSELDLPNGLATLNLQNFQLPDIMSIKNKGIILTQNKSQNALPANHYWGGWIVFNFDSVLPIYKQYIPRGTFKNILLSGKKKVDAIDLVQAECVMINNGAHLKLKNGVIDIIQSGNSSK